MFYMNLNEKLVIALGSSSYQKAYDNESAGFDLYNAGDDVQINPGQSVFIPTGLRISLATHLVAFIKERGSITKTPLIIRAGVIDPGYTGEIFINFVNIGNSPYYLPAGTKTPAQLVVLEAASTRATLSDAEFEKITLAAKRKAGKIGSSNQ